MIEKDIIVKNKKNNELNDKYIEEKQIIEEN